LRMRSETSPPPWPWRVPWVLGHCNVWHHGWEGKGGGGIVVYIMCILALALNSWNWASFFAAGYICCDPHSTATPPNGHDSSRLPLLSKLALLPVRAM
jgi:hypothetical protein